MPWKTTSTRIGCKKIIIMTFAGPEQVSLKVQIFSSPWGKFPRATSNRWAFAASLSCILVCSAIRLVLVSLFPQPATGQNQKQPRRCWSLSYRVLKASLQLAFFLVQAKVSCSVSLIHCCTGLKVEFFRTEKKAEQNQPKGQVWFGVNDDHDHDDLADHDVHGDHNDQEVIWPDARACRVDRSEWWIMHQSVSRHSRAGTRREQTRGEAVLAGGTSNAPCQPPHRAFDKK